MPSRASFAEFPSINQRVSREKSRVTEGGRSKVGEKNRERRSRARRGETLKRTTKKTGGIVGTRRARTRNRRVNGQLVRFFFFYSTRPQLLDGDLIAPSTRRDVPNEIESTLDEG